MGLKDLFIALADVFDGPEAIEGHAKQALFLQIMGHGTPLSQLS